MSTKYNNTSLFFKNYSLDLLLFGSIVIILEDELII